MTIRRGFDIFLSSVPSGNGADSNDDFGGIQTDEVRDCLLPHSSVRSNDSDSFSCEVFLWIRELLELETDFIHFEEWENA